MLFQYSVGNILAFFIFFGNRRLTIEYKYIFDAASKFLKKSGKKARHNRQI
jgi:hypothetical protein